MFQYFTDHTMHLLSGRCIDPIFHDMEKLDLVKLHKQYYTAKTRPEIVEFGKARYISISGKGDPSGEDYMRRVGVLYPVAYTLKFMFKTLGKDFSVAKLEGLWWYDVQKFGRPTIEEAPLRIPRSEWEYRMLIRLPDYVSGADIAHAIETVIFKKRLTLANEVVLYEMTEGKCVQMLHVGPFDQETGSLKLIEAFCKEHGFRQNGLHHEIYLSDFRKTAPGKLRTILREPVI